MAGQLSSLLLCLLLLSALCPGTLCKRGGIFRGRGKSDGNKQESQSKPESQSKGLSKQGLKWVGAAAGAGMLGGTGTGYGLGFLGKGKHGSGNKRVSSEQQVYYREQGQPAGIKSQWNSAAYTNYCVFISVVPFLITAWIRGL